MTAPPKLTPAREAPDRRIYWRCFHCGEAFTRAQERHARDHFGRDCSQTPVCLIREPGEYQVLRALRDAQDELAAYRVEDTTLMRALHSMAADHAAVLRREEERGYEKGLRDASLSVAERAVLNLLFSLARAAWEAADDTEQREDDEFFLDKRSFDGLCAALDKLEELPDDNPDLIMGPAAKAEWALREALGRAALAAQERDRG